MDRPLTYVAVEERAGAYLFVRNSENGRRTLFCSQISHDMADRITDYIAREIVRRERLEAALTEPTGRPRREAHRYAPAWARWSAAFIIGLLTGAAGLVDCGLASPGPS